MFVTLAMVLALVIAFSVKTARAEIFSEVECSAPYNGRCIDVNWDPPGFIYGLPGIFIIATKAEDFRDFYNISRKQQRDFLQFNFRLMLPVHETMVVEENTTKAEALICSGTYPQLLLVSTLAWFSFTGDIQMTWLGWGATKLFGYIYYEPKDLSGNTPPDDVCDKDGTCDSGENYLNCPSDCRAPITTTVPCTTTTTITPATTTIPPVVNCVFDDAVQLSETATTRTMKFVFTSGIGVFGQNDHDLTPHDNGWEDYAMVDNSITVTFNKGERFRWSCYYLNPNCWDCARVYIDPVVTCGEEWPNNVIEWTPSDICSRQFYYDF